MDKFWFQQLTQPEIMLVRKLKCQTCGAPKVNDVVTGFIYCDYCAHFMGYDFKKMGEEATDVFDYTYFAEHGKWPDNVQKYMDIGQQMGPAMAEENAEDFIRLSVEMHELEMDLFPDRFAPKMKIANYRQDYMAFFQKFTEDRVHDGFFAKNKVIHEKLTALAANITQVMVDHKPNWQYDENLEAYFDCVSAYGKKSSEEAMEYPSMALYPEKVDASYADLMQKQMINGFTTLLDGETFKKVMIYLGLQDEYEDLAPPATDIQNCGGCGSDINVPEGAEKMVCEFCGNLNLVKSGNISCMNCGGEMTPDDAQVKNECSYCGSQNKIVQFG